MDVAIKKQLWGLVVIKLFCVLTVLVSVFCFSYDNIVLLYSPIGEIRRHSTWNLSVFHVKYILINISKNS